MTEECSYVAKDEFPIELAKAIPMIVDGIKEGRTVTEIESEICSASNTKWTWNLSVMYETAMMTLAEAIFRLKEIKTGKGRRKKYSIEKQYSIRSQGLYELIRAIEKTSIECEEVFAIIKAGALEIPEEDLPEIDWITGEQTTIPETFNAFEVGDVEMYSDIESINSPKYTSTGYSSPANAMSIVSNHTRNNLCLIIHILIISYHQN